MESISDDIRQWLHKQPDWLQDAAERLLKQASLNTSEINDLVSSLKSSAGQKVTTNRAFNSLVQPSSTSLNLRLKSISALAGIEGLAPRHPLVFENTNLSVVYGHNGSGKSSYTRLLKKATGKPRALDLKSNVFQNDLTLGQCDFTYDLNGIESTSKWLSNAAPVTELRALDIFDADEAAYYLSSESAVAYTPPVVALFENLATACDQIKTQLQDEQSKLAKTLPTLPFEYLATNIGKSYTSLKADVTETSLNTLLTWTAEDELALIQVMDRLNTTDHITLAKQARAKKEQVLKIIEGLQQAHDAYCEVALEHMRSLRMSAQTKRQIATEAAIVESAQLDHVGSTTWRAMWQAAREYSQEVYPAIPFPVVDEARCVLCHQELPLVAQERMKAFENFVMSKLATDATLAESAYTEAKNQLPVALSPALINTYVEAAGLTVDDGWVNYLCEFWQRVQCVRKVLESDEGIGIAQPIDNVVDVVKLLSNFAEALERNAIQYDLDSQGIDRQALQKSKVELEAKKWVTQQAFAIRAEVERLKQFKQYEDWKSFTSSKGVSLKSADIAEKVITHAYVDRFNRELRALGATRIKVELVKSKAEKGKVLHRLQLKGSKNKQNLDKILSDGERRIIALAAYLADLTEKPNNAPFIFDDPISSLDQTWEERVIERLVQLSEMRQVIVFTHRLSFMGLVVEKADGNMSTVHIRQEPWGAGEIGDVPLYGKKPDAALNHILNTRLSQASKTYQEQGWDAYYPLAKSICSDYRILLERIVEFVMLADVVQRHRREVHTKNKIHQLAKITSADCELIEKMMTRYSCFEHSQSNELPVDVPEPDDLKTDIQQLISWHNEFVKRGI